MALPVFLFVCPRLAHPYVCLSGWVSAHKKKPPVKEAFWLWIKKGVISL